MVAGTSSSRTIVASMRTATASAKPTSLMTRSSPATNPAKTTMTISGRRRDDPTRPLQAEPDRLVVGQPGVVQLLDPGEQEDLVVHRQTEPERDDEGDDIGLDPARRREAEQAVQVPVLEHPDEHPQRRCERDRVGEQRLDRDQHRAGHEEQQDERGEGDDARPPTGRGCQTAAVKSTCAGGLAGDPGGERGVERRGSPGRRATASASPASSASAWTPIDDVGADRRRRVRRSRHRRGRSSVVGPGRGPPPRWSARRRVTSPASRPRGTRPRAGRRTRAAVLPAGSSSVVGVAQLEVRRGGQREHAEDATVATSTHHGCRCTRPVSREKTPSSVCTSAVRARTSAARGPGRGCWAGSAGARPSRGARGRGSARSRTATRMTGDAGRRRTRAGSAAEDHAARRSRSPR